MRPALWLITAACVVALAAPALAVREVDSDANARQLPDHGGGELTAETIIGGSDDAGPTTAPRAPRAADAPDPSAVRHYWRGPVGPRTAPPGCPTGRFPAYELVRRDTSTEPATEEVVRTNCDPADTPALPDHAAPPAPTVPEIREVASQRIAPPTVHTSPPPAHGGITGLENWFWYEGPEEVTVESSLRGYTVTATMRPTQFLWHPCAAFHATNDDPTGQALGCPARLASGEPGREPDPDSDGHAAAARWTYETDGRYVIRHDVVWRGRWTFTGHGASSSGALPPIHATGETAYRVEEVRSRLMPSDPPR